MTTIEEQFNYKYKTNKVRPIHLKTGDVLIHGPFGNDVTRPPRMVRRTVVFSDGSVTVEFDGHCGDHHYSADSHYSILGVKVVESVSAGPMWTSHSEPLYNILHTIWECKSKLGMLEYVGMLEADEVTS
jgi:hypothetical protein